MAAKNIIELLLKVDYRGDVIKTMVEIKPD